MQKRFLRLQLSLIILHWCCQCAGIPTGPVLVSDYRLNGDETLRAFHLAKRNLRQSQVKLLNRHGKPLALATIVRRDGLVVTKASELNPLATVTAVLPSGKRMQAVAIGQDRFNDLTLLKLPTIFAGLPTTKLDLPAEGSWAVCLDQLGELRVGIVSGEVRSIAKSSGKLGIVLAHKDAVYGAAVQEVVLGSPADQAKVRNGDRIVAIDQVAIVDNEDLQKLVQNLSPNTPVCLTIQRQGQCIELHATLGDETVFEGPDLNLKMSGRVSQRRSGFREIFQHDSLLKPARMGGAVTDVSGNLIGLNVARRDRVTTYTLTMRELQSSVNRMLTESHH